MVIDFRDKKYVIMRNSISNGTRTVISLSMFVQTQSGTFSGLSKVLKQI